MMTEQFKELEWAICLLKVSLPDPAPARKKTTSILRHTAFIWLYQSTFSSVTPVLTSKVMPASQSVFSVTLMLQAAEDGGLFRHSVPVRQVGREDEDLYTELENIVSGEPSNAATLAFEPGTLRCLLFTVLLETQC